MVDQSEHQGIPTRAIHESYLDMQRALKNYREAKDRGLSLKTPHGELQQTVLTFYEMLRPHLKSETAVQDWWEGKPPTYSLDGNPPDPNDGKGILQIQTTNEVTQLNGQIDPKQIQQAENLKELHEALDIADSMRLQGVMQQDSHIVLTIQQYQMGLHHLDEWETKYKRRVKNNDGFMSDKTSEEVERVRVPIDRLIQAERELVEAANQMNLLSDIKSEREKYHAGSGKNEYPEPYEEAKPPE